MYMYMYVCTMYVLCCIITINIVAALVDFIIATSKKPTTCTYCIYSCLKIVYTVYAVV